MDLLKGDNLTAIDSSIQDDILSTGILVCGRRLRSVERLDRYSIAIPLDWQNKQLHQVKANTELKIVEEHYGQV